jgi:hypothetical protein
MSTFVNVPSEIFEDGVTTTDATVDFDGLIVMAEAALVDTVTVVAIIV